MKAKQKKSMLSKDSKSCCECGSVSNKKNPQYTNNNVCVKCMPVKTFSERFREEQNWHRK